MSKPLSPKSLLIREALKTNQDLGNTELAQVINGSDARKQDKIEVKPGDIAQQREAMKAAQAAQPAAPASPVDLIDKTLDLAAQAGGIIALKRLVDRLADLHTGAFPNHGGEEGPPR